MTRWFTSTLSRAEREELTDILGGIWLVTLMMGLLYLPSFLA